MIQNSDGGGKGAHGSQQGLWKGLPLKVYD